MSQLEFDENVVRTLEEVYSRRDVTRRRALVREALAAQPGERVLDVGSGPGFFAADLVEDVGADGEIVGIDMSAAMLAVAEHRCREHPNVTFVEGEATALPVEDGRFDAALSVQVMEYVAEIDKALEELHRALRPGGRLVIWDVDWRTVSLHSSDEERTARVLATWDEHLAWPALPRVLAARLRGAGFDDVRMEAHPFASLTLDPETYAGFGVPFIAGFAAGRDSIDAEEVAAWLEDQRRLDEQGRFYFSCTQVCFTATHP